MSRAVLLPLLDSQQVKRYVGQQQEFSVCLGVVLEERSVVVRESWAQVTLSIGRIAQAQFIAETRNLVGIKRRVVQTG